MDLKRISSPLVLAVLNACFLSLSSARKKSCGLLILCLCINFVILSRFVAFYHLISSSFLMFFFKSGDVGFL